MCCFTVTLRLTFVCSHAGSSLKSSTGTVALWDSELTGKDLKLAYPVLDDSVMRPIIETASDVVNDLRVQPKRNRILREVM
jgi:hypothetical protein